MIGQFQVSLMYLIQIGVLLAAVIALVDAVTRRAEVFEAAGKLTKNGWLLILGIAVAWVALLGGFLGMMIAAVAAIVYFVDVRPAVGQYSRRR